MKQKTRDPLNGSKKSKKNPMNMTAKTTPVAKKTKNLNRIVVENDK